MDMVDMAMEATARGLLSLAMVMAVATPLSTRAALTTMDLMATTSTTPTARGLLSLDMDTTVVPPATSTCPAPTPAMVLESPTPTEHEASNHTQRTVRLRLYLLQHCYFILLIKTL